MSYKDTNGVEHNFAPNPKMQGEDWKAEFPPITEPTRLLKNKYTGELVPNTPDMALRSDILEPYFEDEDVDTVLDITKVVESKSVTADLDEL